MINTVSVCIPIFNERDNLHALIKRVSDVLVSLGGDSHEILFVDDGSTDGTVDEIQEFVTPPSWGRIRVIKLSRNFGHQAALTAAIDFADRDAAFIIDGDLQDRPEELPRFIALMQQGFDVVYGVRSSRQEIWVLRSCYSAFYWLLEALSDQSIPRNSGDYALISARALKEMRESTERNRFLRGIRAWIGFRQAALEVPRDSRHAGYSKYSFIKLIKLAADGIFSFSIKPLRISIIAGILTMIAGVSYGFYAAYVRLVLDQAPQGFTALTFLLIVFSGMQLLFLGIIGEYIGRIYHEAKFRKTYIIDYVWSTDHK